MTHALPINIAPGLDISTRYLTRHVGIFGATGTGKTTTAAAMIERMSDAGIPVLVLDAKGDMESLSLPMGNQWDVTGERGLTRRIPVTEMGPDILSRALDLSHAQSGVVDIAFAYADDQQVFIESLEDFKRLLDMILKDIDKISADYGLVSPASLAAVQRAILRINRSLPELFGAPELDPFEAAQRLTRSGRGRVTVLRAAPLTEIPGAYGAVAAHILSTLYRQLGEMGDDNPGLAVFIDEAHLLFYGATGGVVNEIERVVRLIRSKGVALIFASQSPADIPPAISGQLATRIQHGLRVSSGSQVAALRAAADGLPSDDWKATRDAIKEMGIGEALVSVPGSDGRPTKAKRVRVTPGKRKTGLLADSYFPDEPPLISPTPTHSERVTEPTRAGRWTPHLMWLAAILLGLPLAL